MMSQKEQVMQQQQIQQLQQELQNELTSSNQLMRLISAELKLIKQYTSCGGEVENNIVQNASLINSLADLQKLDLNKSTVAEENCNNPNNK